MNLLLRSENIFQLLSQTINYYDITDNIGTISKYRYGATNSKNMNLMLDEVKLVAIIQINNEFLPHL